MRVGHWSKRPRCACERVACQDRRTVSAEVHRHRPRLRLYLQGSRCTAEDSAMKQLPTRMRLTLWYFLSIAATTFSIGFLSLCGWSIAPSTFLKRKNCNSASAAFAASWRADLRTRHRPSYTMPSPPHIASLMAPNGCKLSMNTATGSTALHTLLPYTLHLFFRSKRRQRTLFHLYCGFDLRARSYRANHDSRRSLHRSNRHDPEQYAEHSIQIPYSTLPAHHSGFVRIFGCRIFYEPQGTHSNYHHRKRGEPH